MIEKMPLDPRGYVIPWFSYRDAQGRAHFTINDTRKARQALMEDLCPICGGTLFRGRWFIGGSGSAFHERGAYLDPPLHDECAHYALMTCPWLAAPTYARRIDGKTLSGPAPLLIDQTTDPTRPPVFVAVFAIGQRLIADSPTVTPYIKPRKPYRRVEYWRGGQQISEAEAKPIVERELARLSQ